MTHIGVHRQRRKRRALMSRRFSGLLLILGVMGTAIGLGLAGYGMAKDNSRMTSIGAVYLVVSVAVLFFRQAIVIVDMMIFGRKQVSQNIQAKPGFGQWKHVTGTASDEGKHDPDEQGHDPVPPGDETSSRT
jgi:hypothetical protein